MFLLCSSNPVVPETVVNVAFRSRHDTQEGNMSLSSSSGLLSAKLTTGDVMVFDKGTRNLFLVDATHATGIELESVDLADVETLVREGHAQQFDRAALERLQDALSHVVLLGA